MKVHRNKLWDAADAWVLIVAWKQHKASHSSNRAKYFVWMNAKKLRVYTKARGCAQTLAAAGPIQARAGGVRHICGRKESLLLKKAWYYSGVESERKHRENAPVVGSPPCIAKACALVDGVNLCCAHVCACCVRARRRRPALGLCSAQLHASPPRMVRCRKKKTPANEFLSPTYGSLISRRAGSHVAAAADAKGSKLSAKMPKDETWRQTLRVFFGVLNKT